MWVLQTSIRMLMHPKSGERLTLLSMHHLGDSAYFKNVEAAIRKVDFVVLEGWDDLDPSKLHPELHWIYRYQRVSAKLLNLTLQSDWQRGVRDVKFIRADLPLDEIAAFMDKESIKIFPKEWKDYVAKLENYDLKRGGDESLARIQGGLFKSWLDDAKALLKDPRANAMDKLTSMRDEAIWRKLKGLLSRDPAKNIAIQYGALHNWTLEPRLVKELGFICESSSWIDVFGVDESALGAPQKK